jgi:hypothetical protein
VTDEGAPAPKIDTTVPHSARIWNYWLGGKDNYPVDRAAGDKYRETFPQIVDVARAGRYFLARSVRFLAADAGVRQFIDVGTGLPAPDNTHEVAQRVAPECRVVYVDNDPLVLTHARALLTSSPAGRTAYIQADLRDPAAILSSPTVREVLDFSQPIALILVAVLHFIHDEFKPATAIATLLDGLSSGSYLAASHVTGEHLPTEGAATTRAYRSSGVPLQLRDSDEFADLAFSGLELVPPGVVLVSEWRPEGDGPRPIPAEVNVYGGVARKP